MEISRTLWVHFSQNGKCTAHFCPQHHHYPPYGKMKARNGIRALGSPRWAIKTSKYPAHFLAHFSAWLVGKKCAAHFCTQYHHQQSYSKTEARYGIKVARRLLQDTKTTIYLSLPGRVQVLPLLDQKCTAHFCPQGHHHPFYGQIEARYETRAPRSPRQAIETSKHLPHFWRTFRCTFCLVSREKVRGALLPLPPPILTLC